MKTLRKTKIVGTIGPASENRLEELINAGLNVTRINYSHGSWDEQSEKTEEIIRLRKELDVPVALLLDMQGPEIRTGMLVTGKNEKIKLEDGQKFTLVNEDIVGDKDKVSVSYKGLYNDVKPGSKVLIDDGAIELVVDEIVGKDIVCTVVHGNGLGSRKTINLPGTAVRLPALKEKDIQDLKTACEHDYDYVAMSFTRNKDDIDQVRKVLDENGGKDIKIITKVENVEGLEHMEEIVENADVQMIARGDMATETDFTEPPVAQKKFIKLSNRANKPAITATQMLESMTHQPLPTRAEASDVANAIYDRTSAIMLSGECAQGDYPVECVQTMVKIANRVEPEINYWKRFKENDNMDLSDFETKIAYSTCVTAMNMEADAIVCYTHSGDSARKLAGLGAGCPILAITDNRRTFNQLAIAWNVTPIFVEAQENIDKTVEVGIEKLKEKEKILACSTVEGEFYGTPQIDLNNPKYTDKCIIIDIGAKGIEELKQIYKNIIPIYVMPPTQERIKQNRNQNRLQRSLKQIKYAEKVCKWLVINEELEKATDDIEKIILIIQKSGKKVEKITKKDIEYLYKKSMKNPVNKRFLEEFYQQEEQAEEQKTKNKQEQKKKTETKKEKETEEISI